MGPGAAPASGVAMMRSIRKRSLLERFEEKYIIEPNSGCWVWLASTNGHGYGQLAVSRSRSRGAHRIAYELFRGPIPSGMTLDHLCRIRSCVNPDHLEIVSIRVNLLRGNGWSGRKARQTHCLRGHLLVAPNLNTTKDGGRQCRTCTNFRARRRRARLC